MNRRAYLVISGIIFGVVAVLHLLRVVNPDPTKMSRPCAFLGQTFQQSPTFWSQVRNYAKGDLSIYGKNSGVLSDARWRRFLGPINVGSG